MSEGLQMNQKHQATPPTVAQISGQRRKKVQRVLIHLDSAHVWAVISFRSH